MALRHAPDTHNIDTKVTLLNNMTSHIVKKLYRYKPNLNIFARLLSLLAVVVMTVGASAHDPSKYTSSSVLSSGKWGKVKVSSTGIQFVSAATLRQLGFSDPQKVNVYGFGGRVLPDELRASDPDDLPLLPSVKTQAGIWFFGHGHMRWIPASKPGAPATHDSQPYADESWYFLSDRDAADVTLPVAVIPASASAEASSFTQMLLHEQDLIHSTISGRVYLGEDFRATPNRKFTFELTDKASDDYTYRAYFATLANRITTFTITPSGGEIVKASVATSSKSQSAPDDFDPGVYYKGNKVSGTGSASGGQAVLDISYQAAGNVKMARLDFIELGYERKLSLRDGQLYFPLNLAEDTRLTISGVTPDVKIWDVTDHTRPRTVQATVSGSTAVFNAPAGVSEYVAFIPGQGGYAVSDPLSVTNQDIHALNTPDMLIISPYEYMSAANTLADHHRDFNGFTVHILQPEDIYNEFSSGTADPGAFRRLLKMWYDRGHAPAPDNGEPTGKIGYCLILSRPTYDNKLIMEVTRNAGYPRIPIWQSPDIGSSYTGMTSVGVSTSYGTDDYLAMLDDFVDTVPFSMSTQKLRVAVGRMPFKSQSEAAAMVKKYLDYVTSPQPGTWRNQMMLVADDCDDGDNNFYHMSQTDDLHASLQQFDEGRRFQVEKMYLDRYEEVMTQKGPTYPAAKERFQRLWNDGVNFISYIGHASPYEWTDEKLFEWTEIQNMSNRHYPFLYAATCEFARYDQDSPSGAEVLWSNPDGGIIATICPARTVFISNNGTLTKQIGNHFFNVSTPGIGRRIGNIMIDAKNEVRDDNRLKFVIIGDPAMRFSMPENVVKVTSIDGVDPETAEDKPVLEARSRVEIKGDVVNADGLKDTEFNGTIDIVLYDAEKVVEVTHSYNGGAPESKFFNDHSTLLYRGKAKVAAGEWSTTLLIPLEIENLYNPGKLTLYAYSDKGKEAHGATTDFYVNGYDESIPDDNEGPQIHFFALNREDFNTGDVVHTSPVAMAKVSDESGINLSDVGIGHQITLTLDGRTYFSDVNTYYTPDNEDFTAGHIAYPLPELEAGEHTLRLTVWDNANNSASAELTFTVAASKRPEIYDLRTNVNPAREDVIFTLSTDRPMAKVECAIEVFDLNGRRIWTSSRNSSTDMEASISVPWNLCTADGQRVPRGIYLYRATVTSPDGTSATRSRKLAVTAQ